MDKNKLLIKYYEIQRDILMLLEKTDLIIEQLANDTNNNTEITNTYYMLRHSHKNNYSETYYKYIQVGNSGRPQIITRTGYRANQNVLFKTKEDATKFLMKFITSKSRRRCIAPSYFKIVEKVVKHTPVLKNDIEYGEYYM